jgi:hypothetical protein
MTCLPDAIVAHEGPAGWRSPAAAAALTDYLALSEGLAHAPSFPPHYDPLGALNSEISHYGSGTRTLLLCSIRSPCQRPPSSSLSAAERFPLTLNKQIRPELTSRTHIPTQSQRSISGTSGSPSISVDHFLRDPYSSLRCPLMHRSTPTRPSHIYSLHLTILVPCHKPRS